MAHKLIKDHYRITHLVHVRGDHICIGSPYIPDLMAIDRTTGALVKRYSSTDRWSANQDLLRYEREFDADPAKLRELALAPDVFARSIPVYSYDETKGLITDACEDLGWPHVTHTGALQYENTWFAQPTDALLAGLNNAEAWVRNARTNIADLEQRLSKAKDDLVAAIQSQHRFATYLADH